MSGPCIHGFEAGQCASCRSCPHGLVASRCGQCLAESATTSRAAAATDGSPPEPEDRHGWEIFYEPEVSGWRVRAPAAAVLPDSYRSLFLARKAVDHLAATAPGGRAAKPGT